VHVLDASTCFLPRSCLSSVLFHLAMRGVPLSGDCIGRKGAPLAVWPFLDVLQHLLAPCVRRLLSLVVHLHQVYPSQVVLHLLQIFAALPVDHVEDVLDFVGADWSVGLGRVDAKGDLADWRQVVVLVGPGRDQSLLARVHSQRRGILADVTDVGQLQLGLAVVPFQHVLPIFRQALVVDRLDLSASNSRLVS